MQVGDKCSYHICISSSILLNTDTVFKKKDVHGVQYSSTCITKRTRKRKKEREKEKEKEKKKKENKQQDEQNRKKQVDDCPIPILNPTLHAMESKKAKTTRDQKTK